VGRLGVVGGHSWLDEDGDRVLPDAAVRRDVTGPGGVVTVFEADGYVLLQRHGADDYVPAHLVDHARNLGALAAAGCDRVLALSSVGALRVDLPVGTHLVPDDFIALDHPATSVYDDARCHVVPGFSPEWRGRLLGAWRRASGSETIDRGVYWQTNGPRFETPAEIRLLAQYADVVGMTVGAECTVANELGIDYAAVCVVDNLANGIGGARLTPTEFAAGKRANRDRLFGVLAAVMRELA
jgi:5'-methylthioinosine phosphorylase